LLGKRGAPLESAGCIHRTTTVEDICLTCRKYVGDDKPTPPRPPAKTPPTKKTWKPPKEPPVPVPEQHYRIARQLYQRGSGITVRELARAVKLEQNQVQEGLKYLERNGLAVCHGRRSTAHWAATDLLHRKGPLAAARDGFTHSRRRP